MRYLKSWNRYILENVQPTKKADLVGVDVENFYKTLDSIDKDISQEKLGSMSYKKEVESIQVALLLLGYKLPRFGVDGFFGGETAIAVNNFLNDIKQENSSEESQSGEQDKEPEPEQELSRKQKRQQRRQERKDKKNESLFFNKLFEDNFVAPVGDKRISSPFGMRVHPVTGKQKNHNGVDFAAPSGEPIKSPADGRVIDAGFYDNSCGGTIIIQHNVGDLRSSFCHLSKIDVQKGDDVTQNQIIGEVGGAKGERGAGTSTGPHLHYGIKKAGEWIDPLQVLGSEISDKNKLPSTGELSSSQIKSVVLPVSAIKIMIEKLKEKGVTSEELKKYSSSGQSGNINLEGISGSKEAISKIVEWLKKVNITNPLVHAAILGCINKESGFKPQNEKSYKGNSASSIRKIFGKRVSDLSDSQIDELKQNDEKFWDKVYGGRYGNTSPGDGSKYSGKGYNQLTFKGNYEKYGKLIKQYGMSSDIVANPQLLNTDLDVAAAVNAVYFLTNLNNSVLKQKYGNKNQNDFSDLDTAVKAVYQANAGAGKDISGSFDQGALQKTMAFAKNIKIDSTPSEQSV